MTLDDIRRTIDPSVWMDNIQTLFSRMDSAYDKVADIYGFHCRGCEDNCCLTRFYHHTLVEYLYLKKGLEILDRESLETVMGKARDVIDKTADADLKGVVPRFMCPLNSEGLCLVYAYRPMVCRLHGMEHELRKPGQEPLRGCGCDLFCKVTQGVEYVPFDRTPFYRDMAALEGYVRQVTGYREKIRYTISEMVLL